MKIGTGIKTLFWLIAQIFMFINEKINLFYSHVIKRLTCEMHRMIRDFPALYL